LAVGRHDLYVTPQHATVLVDLGGRQTQTGKAGEPIEARPPVSLKTAPIRIGSSSADSPHAASPARTNTAATTTEPILT
jgi:hypothetical protein